jgi:protein-tyrosine phosphatase
MNQVLPYPLWIGHAGDGRDYARLLDHGIRAVVQLAAEEPPLQPPRELIYLRFPLNDGADNPEDLLDLAVGSLASLIRLKVPTLVCCGAGMSRSPAVSAFAIGSATGEPAEEVLRSALVGRPGDVSPGLWGVLNRLA